jgi:hypothetical protein
VNIFLETVLAGPCAAVLAARGLAGDLSAAI